MPAKTVVLESLSKFTGEGHELLQPGDYTQLTGRAGRRGIDLRGYGVVLHSPYVRFDQVAEIAAAGSHELVSSFRPTYNMAANLVSNYPRRRAEELLAASFAQFQRKNRASAVAAGIDGLESELVRLRDQAVCERGDIWSYLDEADAERGRARHRNRAMFANRLRGGDVVEVPRGRRAGRYLVLSRRSSGRGDEGRLVLLGTSGKVTSWTWEDLVEGTSRLGSITLPTPFRPKERGYQQNVLRLLRRFRPDGKSVHPGRGGATAVGQPGDRLPGPERPSPSGAPDAPRRTAARRAQTESVRTGEDLVRDFESILDVLGSWDYVDGWQLTAQGEQLGSSTTNSICCSLRRCGEGASPGSRWPRALLWRRLLYRAPPRRSGWRMADRGNGSQVRHRPHLVGGAHRRGAPAPAPRARRPEPGFASLAHRWASSTTWRTSSGCFGITGRLRPGVQADTRSDPADPRRLARDGGERHRGARGDGRGVVAAGGLA